jgi:hypothetical protein
MSIIESEARVAVKNTLYLTDFSQPSEAALPFVVGMLAITARLSMPCMS